VADHVASLSAETMRACLSLLLLALVSSSVAAAPSGDVRVIDADNFDSLVVQSLETWVVEYYSPRCGTCAELAPLYAELARRHGARLHFGGVDIDTDAGMALAQRLDVLSEGVPSIKAYTSLGSQHGVTVFTGWQVPTVDDLERTLLKAVHTETADAAEAGTRLMKA
jgi:thioredoxin-like negative regulator of GroEL